MNPLIRVEDLRVSFHGTPVVHGISFELRGEAAAWGSWASPAPANPSPPAACSD